MMFGRGSRHGRRPSWRHMENGLPHLTLSDIHVIERVRCCRKTKRLDFCIRFWFNI
jgi:hypothetical protein